MVKKGDTLIEVTLAIGIFSMIAIAVVSVVNSSTSGAQSALEITLAREEIDAQAEALRFIHASYIASSGSATTGNSKYADLWQNITSRAITNEDSSILEYSPNTCAELYDNSYNLYSQGAFIINTRQLASSNTDNILLRASNYASATLFHQASTYPRIIYRGAKEDDTILDQGNGTIASRVEGIYIVAVQDLDGTYIISDGSGTASKVAAYYDFYIRTCWYGPGASRPSTISTVIRLYDPDAVSSGQARYTTPSTTVVYHGNGNDDGTGNYSQKIAAGTTRNLLPNRFSKIGNTFSHWEDKDGNIYGGESSYTAADGNNYLNLYAAWIPNYFDFTVRYFANGTGVSGSIPDQVLSGADVDTKFAISDNTNGYTRSGYRLTGWNSAADGSGTSYALGEWHRVSDFARITDFNNSPRLDLYAQWERNTTTVTATLTWGASPGDIDLHLSGQKSNNANFHVYYSHRSETDSDGLKLATLNGDYQNGYGPEIITLEAKNDKNYYFYVNCLGPCSKASGATLKVNIQGSSTQTFSLENTVEDNRYWNVFAFKNGQLVTRQTNTSSPETNY